MKKKVAILALMSAAYIGEASVVTEISQAPGFGGNVDLTAGSYLGWGYDSGGLADGFSNVKSGTEAAGVSVAGNSSTRDYGYTFTFADGNSPASGTAVASSGGLAGISSGATTTFTLTNVVSSTETRRLTLYLGGYHSAGVGKLTLTLDAALTGGTADETGTAQVFVINSTTSDAVGFDDGYAVATYTVEFASATESDVVVDITYSNVGGTRNWGLSGYKLEALSGPGVSIPAGLAATASNNSVSLDWNDNPESNVTYSVYRSTTSGSYGSALTNGLASSDFVDSTAINYTTYYYAVTAADTNSNESAQSAEVSAMPLDPADTTPPAAPTGLAATAGSGIITLDWNQNAEADLAGYSVYRTTTSGSYGSALTNGLTVTNFVDTSVVNGTMYYYEITASDFNSNESLKSSEFSAASVGLVADYTFDGSSAASVDTDTGSTASELSDVDGIGTGTNGLNAAFNSGTGLPAPSLKWTIGDFNDGTVLDDDYLSFTVTPESGKQLDFVEFSFDYVFPGGSGSTIYLFSSQDGFASTDDAIDVFNEADEDHWNTYTASLAAMSSAPEATEFRLYFDTTGTFPTAEIKIDNIRLAANAGVAPPDAPTGLAATPGDASVSLDWDDNTESNLTYSVYRSATSGSYGSALTNGLTASEFVDGTAINFTTYYYVVTAVDTNAAESASSSEVSATPADPSNQAPAFSTNLIVKANAEQGLTYSASIGSDASDPEDDSMTFSLVSTSAWLSVASDGGLSGTPGASDVGTNTFTVQVSAAGGSDSATLRITVDADTTAPAVPTGLTATAGNGSAIVSWTPSGETDLAGYNLYRSTVSSNYSAALVTNLQSSSYIDSSAANGTTYYYAVSAVDESGNESAQSAEDSATPDESILQPLVWLDASQGVGLDSGKVSVWTNLASPGTFDAVQADPAKRPVVLLEEWAGHPLVYFDGTDDLLTLDGTVSNALFESELTVFFVGRRRTGGSFSTGGGMVGNFQTGGDWGSQGWGLGMLDTGVSEFRVGNSKNNALGGGTAELGVDFMVMSARYEDIGGGAGQMSLFGTLEEDLATKNTSPFAIQSSTVDIGLGMFCGWKSLEFNAAVEMDVAEIRIYGSTLSDTNRQAIYDELTAKYSLAAKEWYNVVDFQPDSYEAAADSQIEISFDVPMNPDTITNISVGAGGLDGYPEGGDWQAVSGQWAASVSNTVFTFTPDSPFDAGELILCEIATNVASAAGGINTSLSRRNDIYSFVVDTGKTYSDQRTVLDPMAVVSNAYVDEFGVTNVVAHDLPMVLHIPDTAEPCPVMFWVHGGSFNGGNTGTLTNSAAFDAVKAGYFSKKLGIATVGVSWRSTKSKGTFTKAVSDVNTAIQYVIDNAETLGIDTSRMGLYGGSAGTPMSSLISQLDTNIVCYIGFNGSYNLLTGYGSGGGAFETDVPGFEANSAIFNIRTNPPATLLMHGTGDGIIPYAQSVLYAQAIIDAGGEAEALLYRDEPHAFYNDGNPMAYPTMVASSEFLSRVFGLGVYQAGYAKWLADNGVADTAANFYEYAMGSDPTDGLASTNNPVFIKANDSFLYVHPKRSDDPNITYTVETTTNLVSGSWTNQRVTVTGTNVTGGTLDFITNEVDTAENEKFIRLKIEQ